MPRTRSAAAAERAPAGLKKLVARYESVATTAAKSEETRQRLAREMVDTALKRKDARIRIAVHDLSRPKAKPKVTDLPLSDPRAAALRLEFFCNVKIAFPLWLCTPAFCPVFIPFPLPPILWFGYFLIFCDINLCNLTVTCYYIGI